MTKCITRYQIPGLLDLFFNLRKAIPILEPGGGVIIHVSCLPAHIPTGIILRIPEQIVPRQEEIGLSRKQRPILGTEAATLLT